jgi:Glu-tRNA(Gln) amidotransferase subunit E-like FAD-binding protein
MLARAAGTVHILPSALAPTTASRRCILLSFPFCHPSTPHPPCNPRACTTLAGTYSAWKANAIGRNSKTIREFLEKNYAETSGRDTAKLAIRALMETVEAGSKNIEVAVMERATGLRILSDEEVDALVKEVADEKAAAEAAKRGGQAAMQS